MVGTDSMLFDQASPERTIRTDPVFVVLRLADSVIDLSRKIWMGIFAPHEH